MPFSFKCADIGMKCGFQATGDTMDQLMAKVGDHAKQAHNMTSIAPDVMAKIRAAIKK